ncbi:hypothetical protein TNCV_2377011 [Trichonephila clavipes]|nr:hypothetical protein TNCV_2377011 [Trichonephila clavipes]
METPGSSFTPTPLGYEDNLERRKESCQCSWQGAIVLPPPIYLRFHEDYVYKIWSSHKKQEQKFGMSSIEKSSSSDDEISFKEEEIKSASNENIHKDKDDHR